MSCLTLIIEIFQNLSSNIMDQRRAQNIHNQINQAKITVTLFEKDIPLRLAVYNTLGYSEREEEEIPTMAKE